MRLYLLIVFSLCACSAQSEGLTPRERQLLDRIDRLEARLASLEERLNPEPPPTRVPEGLPPAGSSPSAVPRAEAPPLNSWFKDTSVNFFFDGYLGWNPRRPAGGLNLLRAYDTTANSFVLNQTGMMVERLPDVNAGRRWGYRLDLLFGQATEALHGPQNEPRPDIYRNIYQAYGTYVIPAGRGLTMDFGKWASSLGPEGTYAKDQINYSRSFLFNFLPFYHNGFRFSYPVNDKLALGYWLVNGANQTEDFNGFKSQLAQVIVKPSKTITWTSQYYVGKEQRSPIDAPNPGPAALPAQRPSAALDGKTHIIDNYVFWTPNDRLTLGGEFDYIIARQMENGPPAHVLAGAAYLRVQITPKLYFGQRNGRLNDSGGLFSGVRQNLNASTSTLGYRFSEGFEPRLEYRHDFTNTPFFLTHRPGVLSRHQDTFTLGLLWWFGGKTGAW